MPDYVATYVQKAVTGHRGGNRTVIHRRGWTRIDSELGNLRSSTAYFGPNSQHFIIYRQPSHAFEQQSVGRGLSKDRISGASDKPSKTGESDTVLGERCEIWNVPERFQHLGYRRFSCVTPDGIELWNRPVFDSKSGQSYEATSLKRQPVTPDEVRPPVERLDLKWWLALPTVAVAQPLVSPRDVTVITQPERPATSDREPQTSTLRRHHPWTSREDQYGDGRRTHSYSYEMERLTITYSSNAAGAGVHIIKWFSDAAFIKPVEMNRTETILGEQCAWFNMKPNLMDRDHGQCRTADGVVLKEMQGSDRGGAVRSTVAVQLSRDPVALDTVMPPPAILSPKTWGIPK